MVLHAAVSTWLNDYIEAWKTYDPAAISKLFSEDAEYSYGPFKEPIKGRTAIIESWLTNQDTPGTYDAEYQPIAVEGHVAVVNGRTRYFEQGSQALHAEFDNIFVLRFDDLGRCTEFREWYIQRPATVPTP